MERYSKFLTILLIVIIIGVIGLLAYLGFSFLKDEQSDQDAAEYVKTFTQTSENVTQTNDIANTTDISGDDIVITETDSTSQSGTSQKKKTYKGFEVIGTIQIPKTNIEYPVLKKVSATSLETSVVALYPNNAVLNSKGNVVIIGHNYRNSRFFSNNKKLTNGDKIYITDLNNNKVTYKVYKVFQTSENDTSFYNRDTNGAREITLSTCTDDSKARTIILAKADGD